MLDDAVDAFLDGVSERGFDEPFMALLRAEGYSNVHLVHGEVEMGKDVIAQKDGEQWAFQSKAGNITLSTFRPLRDQLYDLQMSDISAPGFRTDLPRRAVLVTTGRLTGKAPLAAQEYRAKAAEREQPDVEFWNRDTLIAMLSGRADAVLRGSVDGQLYGLIGAIDERRVDMDAIEVFSRRWMTWEPERLAGLGIIEAALACERLRQTDRLDLACHLALCAVRGAWAAAGLDEGMAAPLADAAAGLFDTYARELWDDRDERLLRVDGIVGLGFSGWVTYAIRYLRFAEIVALLGLRVRADDEDLSRAIADWLARFVTAQPGVARPIGDRYAVSVIPVAALLAADHEDTTAALLRATTVWTCDRYDRGGFGLSGPDAPPSEEIARVLGAPLEHVALTRRQSSQLAGVLLDTAAMLDSRDVYSDVRNDTVAVELYPLVLIPGEAPDLLSCTGMANRWDVNPDYADELEVEAPAAPHLDLSGSDPATGGRWWDLLAISAALRDRHFPASIASAASSLQP